MIHTKSHSKRVARFKPYSRGVGWADMKAARAAMEWATGEAVALPLAVVTTHR